MKINRIINFGSIIFGGVITLYTQAQKNQNIYLICAGIMLLMFGIYRTSRGIPSKSDNNKEDTIINTEHDN